MSEKIKNLQNFLMVSSIGSILLLVHALADFWVGSQIEYIM